MKAKLCLVFIVIFGFIFWSLFSTKSVSAACTGTVYCGHIEYSGGCTCSEIGYKCNHPGDTCGFYGTCNCGKPYCVGDNYVTCNDSNCSNPCGYDKCGVSGGCSQGRGTGTPVPTEPPEPTPGGGDGVTCPGTPDGCYGGASGLDGNWQCNHRGLICKSAYSPSYDCTGATVGCDQPFYSVTCGCPTPTPTPPCPPASGCSSSYPGFWYSYTPTNDPACNCCTDQSGAVSPYYSISSFGSYTCDLVRCPGTCTTPDEGCGASYAGYWYSYQPTNWPACVHGDNSLCGGQSYPTWSGNDPACDFTNANGDHYVRSAACNAPTCTPLDEAIILIG